MAKFSMTTLIELEELLPGIAQQYHRLALIVGPAGSGKTPLLQELCRRWRSLGSATRQGLPYLNVNLALSQHLLDLTSKERPLRVRRLLADVISERPGDVVALDNVELLFDPVLHQDPLALLQGLSRVKTLIAAWGGVYVKNVLTYAEPGHPEYRHYERPDVAVFVLPFNRHTIQP
jgi:hypothetical protein